MYLVGIMQAKQVIEKIIDQFDDVIPKASWGETSLFYNPGKLLPNGVYFCTIKEKDGGNDKASNLDRVGIYRLSIGFSKESYNALFGKKPQRPNKGGIIKTNHDFTQCNVLMPHPIYGWMSWVQILNPSEHIFDEIFPYLEESYLNAVNKFNKKTTRNP